MTINKVVITNFFATLLTNLITFIASAYFSRMIIPAEYGLLAIASTLAGIFSTILSLQVVSSIGPSTNQFGIDCKNEYRLTIAMFSTLIYILCSAIILTFKKIFLLYLNLNTELLLFALFYGYGLYMLNIYITSNNFDFKPRSNFIVKILVASLTFIVSVYFLYRFSFKNNLLAREIGLGCTYLFFGLFVFFDLLRKNSFKFPTKFKDYLQFCLPFTLPLIFNYIINDSLQLTDKLMIKYLINIEQVGIYSLAVSFATTCLVIATLFENSFTPFFYKYIDESDLKSLKLHTDYYIELYTVISCGFILLSKEVFYLYADVKYRNGIVLIPIIVLNYYFVFLNLITLNFQLYHKESRFITAASFIALILNIVLNFLLIKSFGVFGAAVASALSRVSIFLLNHIFAKYRISVNYIFDILFYLKWVLCLLIAITISYLAIDYTIARWILGFIIGMVELLRIMKRKTVF